MSWLIKFYPDLSCFEGIDGINNTKIRHRLKKLFYNDSYRVYPYEKPQERSLYKYWKNRSTIFKLIDEGDIFLTDELWFSVTPENLAQFTASYIRHCLPHAKYVVDVFCGGGGNVIQFARLFDKVYGVDSNIDHLYCTYKNAQCYEVTDKVNLIYGDWEAVLNKTLKNKINQKQDCIFASPPWGGVNYLKQDTYDLEKHLEPVSLSKLLVLLFKLCDNVVLFLPRNSNLDQLSAITEELLGPGEKCKVVYVKDNGYMKGILVFWGRPFYDFSDQYPEGNDNAPKLEQERDINIRMEDLY